MFNEKLKEFGVSNPSELSEEDQIKFYDSLKPVSESVETEEEKIDEKKAEESKHEEEEKAEESNCDDEEEEEEEAKLEEGMIGIKTGRGFTPKDFEDALKKGGVKIDKMDRLTMTLTALKTNDVDKAKKVIADFEGASLMESTINEADIKDEASFRKYAEDILKKAHGDDYDEAKAKKMIDDIAKKYGEDGDWGDAVGVVQQSLA